MISANNLATLIVLIFLFYFININYLIGMKDGISHDKFLDG